MTLKFHNVTRFAGILFAGFSLLAAGEVPQDTALKAIPAVTAAATDAVTAPQNAIVADTSSIDQSDDTSTPAVQIERPAHLRTLVDQVVALPETPMDGESRCLAKAVFFEARGEPLEGQLAVAQVILNRVASGRFAASVCGVVDQPGQFTFARRSIATRSPDYQVAAAIAVIAAAQRWLQIAPRAMNFHAARVSPSWGNMQLVSRIGNHVFYR